MADTPHPVSSGDNDPEVDLLDERWRASLRQLAAGGVERKYRAGTILIHEGDTGQSLFIINEGLVRAFVAGPNGRDLTLGTYGPGEYVGEMSLDGGPRSASIITVEPTVCAIVDRPALLAHIRAQPEFALAMMMRLIARARLATESAGGLALLDVYGRIRALLEREAIDDDTGARRIAVRLTHQDIASRVGASREMVSKVMKDLARGGYIEVERKQIRLLKPLPQGW